MGWTSGQSYSQDLRDRIIATVDSGLGVYEAASLFQVSVSYIYKALARRRTTGRFTLALSTESANATALRHHQLLLDSC